jgi:actin-related protein
MPNSLLVMISVGLNRGLVVDIGFEQTSVIPVCLIMSLKYQKVFDGYILYESHSHLFRPKENDSMEEEKRIEILARSQNRSSMSDYLLNLFIEGDRCVLLDSLLLTPITIRKDLASQIVICGGNALIPGISRYFVEIIIHS